MPDFNPERLTLARERRGMTMVELAKRVGVTARILTDHENGRKTPTDATLAKFAEALEFPIEFFRASRVRSVTGDSVSFRSLKAMTAKQRYAALGACAIALELDSWIGSKFRLPAVALPDLRGASPEEAAMELRSEWVQGVRPIRNMIHLMELHGVRVYSLSERSRNLDAFSFWKDGVPYCFLNTLKSAEHSRFDAAHELAHLALHQHGIQRGSTVERQADAFASAFLMPRDSVLATVRRSPLMETLIAHKQVWGVSLAALAHRTHRLSLLSDWQYRDMCIRMGKLGYRTAEPPPVVQHETSQVLRKVFAALKEDGVTKNALARDLNVHPNELESLVFGLVTLGLSGTESHVASCGRQGAPPLQLVR